MVSESLYHCLEATAGRSMDDTPMPMNAYMEHFPRKLAGRMTWSAAKSANYCTPCMDTRSPPHTIAPEVLFDCSCYTFSTNRVHLINNISALPKNGGESSSTSTSMASRHRYILPWSTREHPRRQTCLHSMPVRLTCHNLSLPVLWYASGAFYPPAKVRHCILS